MTNDEFPMTKAFPKPNDEDKACELAGTIWSFVLRPSFDIRHSDFDIFQSHDSSAECGMKRQRTTNENSKTQIPKKPQISISNWEPPQRGLELDVWDFFGAWGLGIGNLPSD